MSNSKQGQKSVQHLSPVVVLYQLEHGSTHLKDQLQRSAISSLVGSFQPQSGVKLDSAVSCEAMPGCFSPGRRDIAILLMIIDADHAAWDVGRRLDLARALLNWYLSDDLYPGLEMRQFLSIVTLALSRLLQGWLFKVADDVEDSCYELVAILSACIYGVSADLRAVYQTLYTNLERLAKSGEDISGVITYCRSPSVEPTCTWSTCTTRIENRHPTSTATTSISRPAALPLKVPPQAAASTVCPKPVPQALLDWAPWKAQELLSQTSMSRKENQDGFIYIFRCGPEFHKGLAGCWKVGWTKHLPERRLEQIRRTCGRNLHLHKTYPLLAGVRIRHAYRCERIIHAHLIDMGRLVVKDCKCGDRHQEYFKGHIKDIELIVSRYVAHMRSTYGDAPYDGVTT